MQDTLWWLEYHMVCFYQVTKAHRFKYCKRTQLQNKAHMVKTHYKVNVIIYIHAYRYLQTNVQAYKHMQKITNTL